MNAEAQNIDFSGVHGIMFVCLGNICRSPMAEALMRQMLAKAGRGDVTVASSATSPEELGNPVYPPAASTLRCHGVPLPPGHRATLLRSDDLSRYDLFLGMERANLRGMLRILGDDAVGKCFRLLDFSASPRDIADPWYTGEFNQTWNDISEGCQTLLELLQAAR